MIGVLWCSGAEQINKKEKNFNWSHITIYAPKCETSSS